MFLMNRDAFILHLSTSSVDQMGCLHKHVINVTLKLKEVSLFWLNLHKVKLLNLVLHVSVDFFNI